MHTILKRAVAIGCIFAYTTLLAGEEDVYLTPSRLEQRDDGYVLMTCDFIMPVPALYYVVVTGMNRTLDDGRPVGAPDSGVFQVFVGGSWHDLPSERICGTGLGSSHFIPAYRQCIEFGGGMHARLRAFVAQHGDPSEGFLFRGAFSVDLVDQVKMTVEAIEIRSTVGFARMDDRGIRTSMVTLYAPKTDAEAQDLLERIREEGEPGATDNPDDAQ